MTAAKAAAPQRVQSERIVERVVHVTDNEDLQRELDEERARIKEVCLDFSEWET